jgi:glutamate 5-kinase
MNDERDVQAARKAAKRPRSEPQASEVRHATASARRLVVKVGSAILTEGGALRPRVFSDIARQVSRLRDAGREVVVVSSGAIALGSRELGWSGPGGSIPEKQAAAAVGQISLVEVYRRRFARHGVKVAQILVTRVGLEDRERFLNARHTLTKLLELGVVPIVNENDTVATDEIRFGDNDNLSATIVNLVAADLLVILTDVDGLYHAPPQAGRPLPPLYDVVEAITPEIERAAQGSPHAFGRGGMTTKLQAARAAARGGAATVLCSGRSRDVLLRVAEGQPVGTLFLAGSRIASRKHWLAFTARPHGELRDGRRGLVRGPGRPRAGPRPGRLLSRRDPPDRRAAGPQDRAGARIFERRRGDSPRRPRPRVGPGPGTWMLGTDAG